MVTPITQETLIGLLVAQCRSADLWIRVWQQYRDASGIRNAAMAIGKIQGIYNVLLYQIQGDENLPEAVIEMMKPYQAAWDELGS